MSSQTIFSLSLLLFVCACVCVCVCVSVCLCVCSIWYCILSYCICKVLFERYGDLLQDVVSYHYRVYPGSPHMNKELPHTNIPSVNHLIAAFHLGK